MNTQINKSLIDFEKYSKEEDENYNKLEKKIIKLLELYDKTKGRDIKEKILDNIELIKNRLEVSSINSSITYPDYDDKDFGKP